MTERDRPHRGPRAAVGPGDFIGHRKGGLAHTIRNTDTETPRCIVAGDYPRLGTRIHRHAVPDRTLVDHEAMETVKAGAKE